MKTAVATPDIPVTWAEMLAFMDRHYRDGLERDADYRPGQAYFNALYEVYPEIADLVRTTDADPFYAHHKSDGRFILFLETISSFFQ